MTRQRRPAATPMPADPAALMVTDAGRLEEFCAALREAGEFGFDTEFIRERSYKPQVCLVQAAGAERLALIDPLRVDLGPFWDLVTDPAVRTIVHAGEQDFELCYLWTGRAPANVFDVQVAAGLAGVGYPLSYERLAKEVLKVSVGKSESFSEWGRRPLTKSQLRYAVEDVLHLLPLKEHLDERLASLGRATWVREEMGRLERAAFYAREVDEAWTRVRGGDGLSRRGRAVLRELAVWREHAAEAEDLPPRTCLRDEVLVGLARRTPQSAGELRNIRGLPAPVASRHGRDLLEAIGRGLAVPGGECPEAADRRDDEPSDRMLVDLAAAAGQGLCLAGSLAHPLLATRSDYQDLVTALAGRAGAADPPPRLLAGWRREFAGDVLAAVLEGRAALRVSGMPKKPRLDVG